MAGYIVTAKHLSVRLIIVQAQRELVGSNNVWIIASLNVELLMYKSQKVF